MILLSETMIVGGKNVWTVRIDSHQEPDFPLCRVFFLSIIEYR